MMKLFGKQSPQKQDEDAKSSAPLPLTTAEASSSSPKKSKQKQKRTKSKEKKKQTVAAATAAKEELVAAASSTKNKKASASPPPQLAVEPLPIVNRGGGGGGSSSVSMLSGIVAAPRSTSPISDASGSIQEIMSTSDDDGHHDNNHHQEDHDDDENENVVRTSPRLQLSDIQESVNDDNEDDNDNDDDEKSGDDDDDKSMVNKNKPVIKLYKSSRLKAYMTLTFASGISWSSALSSTETINVTVVPATEAQKKYAMAASIVSMCIVGPILTVHFDSFSPLQRFWMAAFAPKSRIELALALFLMLWWSVAVGVQTSISGVAGDGKGQVSVYFSSWVCCWASYWIFERWWVAAGYSSFKSFITSWPYRAPGWICIFVAAIFTLVWYADLKENYGTLSDRKSEANLYL
jgi:hypothetical protein